MIKAIIFDCFGVLVREGWTPFRDEHFHSLELKEWADSQMHCVSRGEISTDEFVDTIAAKVGVEASVFKQMLHDNPANEELFIYIRDSLKSRFAIGMLSNVGMDRLHELFTSDQLKLIDEFALSYDIGVAKPDPKAYEIIAAKLRVEPSECLFVDDIEKYCDGARAVGMQAIQYEGFESFREKLEQSIVL